MESARAVLARIRNPGRVLVDIPALLLLFGGVDFILDPGSPGWFSTHPNPYLLIPVLIGGRYGAPAGIYAAGACALWLAGCEGWAERAFDPAGFLREHSLLLFALFIFGLAAGEVQTYFRRKAGRLELLLERSSERLRVLDRDLRRIARINRELQERLLVSDNRTFAMDVEIRALYECRKEEIWDKALAVLARTEEVACAALYAPAATPEGLPERKALLGGDERLGERLDPGDHPLVAEALRRGGMVVLTDWLAGGADPSREPFLFAKPLFARGGRWFGLLVVSRMPFLRFDAQSLARIDLTLDWIGEIIDLRLGGGGEHEVISGAENKKLLAPGHFRRMLDLSVSAWRELRVPSGLVVARVAGGDRERRELLLRVNRRVRAGDFLVAVEGAGPNAVVLLPFTSERGTRIFMESCRELLDDALGEGKPVLEAVPVEEFEREDLLWEEIERRAGAPVG